ncbi:acyl-CoA-binding protein [Acaromyces ingoldii]|uniref:Acyl-CoA-binding protein n=1 Tax=Acaromyces ingoldii TaxID=215250 RepID=A0A316YWA6_9BASI|nr:acyl-CoA-binding protein [Acaromyces ingoldii]PWN93810.1 acyl-CoA-binding protein [Acaromyces ingoldii]
MSASQFDKAVAIIGSLPKDGPVQPTQTDQLKFYGLFKQATIGDVNTSRPGMMDFTGKAKWDAWKKNEGTSSEDAKKQYVEELIGMFEKHSDNEDAKKYIEEINSA